MPQNIFKIYDGRTSFWQWDTGQKLIVLDRTVDQVHFSNKSMNRAVIKEVYIDDDGVRVCEVPDAILKSPHPLIAYAYVMEEDNNKTICMVRFSVSTRPMPEDYTYEVDDRFKDLVDKIEAVEDVLESGTSIKKFNTLAEAEAWAQEYEAVGVLLSVRNGSEWIVYMANEDHSLERVGDTTQLIIDVEKLQRLVGEESVENQIRDAIIALELADTYEAKGAAEVVRNALIEETRRAKKEEEALTRELHELGGYIDENTAAIAAEKVRAEAADEMLAAEIDEAIKFTEQNLTDAQRAQARRNIAKYQLDWRTVTGTGYSVTIADASSIYGASCFDIDAALNTTSVSLPKFNSMYVICGQGSMIDNLTESALPTMLKNVCKDFDNLKSLGIVGSAMYIAVKGDYITEYFDSVDEINGLFIISSNPGTIDGMSYTHLFKVVKGDNNRTGYIYYNINTNEYRDNMSLWNLSDATLSKANHAADAKAVGDALNELSEKINNNTGADVETATEDEIIKMLIQEDMLPAVADADGSILADENENILLW